MKEKGGKKMFKSHEGLIETQNFADFYHYITTTNKAQIKCPDCGYIMYTKIFPSFNLLQLGKAEFTCSNEDCHFNKNKIVIKSIGGNNHELGKICFGI